MGFETVSIVVSLYNKQIECLKNCGCFNSTINLWDVDTGEKMKTLIGHTSHVTGVEFSPDGKTLVSGSRDGAVFIWEINI